MNSSYSLFFPESIPYYAAKKIERDERIFITHSIFVTVPSVLSNTLRDAQKLYLRHNFALSSLGIFMHENTSRNSGYLNSNLPLYNSQAIFVFRTNPARKQQEQDREEFLANHSYPCLSRNRYPPRNPTINPV